MMSSTMLRYILGSAALLHVVHAAASSLLTEGNLVQNADNAKNPYTKKVKAFCEYAGYETDAWIGKVISLDGQYLIVRIGMQLTSVKGMDVSFLKSDLKLAKFQEKEVVSWYDEKQRKWAQGTIRNFDNRPEYAHSGRWTVADTQNKRHRLPERLIRPLKVRKSTTVIPNAGNTKPAKFQRGDEVYVLIQKSDADEKKWERGTIVQYHKIRGWFVRAAGRINYYAENSGCLSKDNPSASTDLPLIKPGQLIKLDGDYGVVVECGSTTCTVAFKLYKMGTAAKRNDLWKMAGVNGNPEELGSQWLENATSTRSGFTNPMGTMSYDTYGTVFGGWRFRTYSESEDLDDLRKALII